MDIIKELITCEYCLNILTEPIDLPCKKIICKKHVSELKNDNEIIDCIFCNNFHENIDLQINEKTEKLIKSNVHNLLNNLGSMHKNALEMTDRFERTLQEYTQLSTSGELFVRKHFSNIRNMVDCRKEKLIQEINEKADSLISALNGYEEECLKNIDKKPIENLDIKMKKSKDWKAYLSQFVIDETEWTKISSDAFLETKNVEKLIETFQKNALGDKIYRFNTGSLELNDKTFGYLDVQEKIISFKFDANGISSKTHRSPFLFGLGNSKENKAVSFGSLSSGKPVSFGKPSELVAKNIENSAKPVEESKPMPFGSTSSMSLFATGSSSSSTTQPVHSFGQTSFGAKKETNVQEQTKPTLTFGQTPSLFNQQTSAASTTSSDKPSSFQTTSLLGSTQPNFGFNGHLK
jgi:hypothetical protein